MLKNQYWAYDNNFGDALNPYIQRAFGIKSKCSPAETADFVCIGSSMERLLANSLIESHVSTRPIDVWTTGFHFPIGEHKWYKKIETPEKFARKVNIRALRGKESLRRAEQILDRKLPDVTLGDGGLLTSLAFKAAKTKKYRLGIVAHMDERRHPVFKQIRKNIKNSVLINIFQAPDQFIKQLTECEAIISSALHPVIVADSYNIPNQWINLSKAEKVSMYKFGDYYSVFNLKPNYFDLTLKNFTEDDLSALKNNYKITKPMVEAIQNKLIDAHPYSSEIKELSFNDIQMLKLQRLKLLLAKFMPVAKLRRRLRKPNVIWV